MEQEIEALEQTLDEIKTQMAQAGSDYVALQRLTEEQQALEAKIEQKMDRWAELEEMAQRMRS
ncbi:MAG: ABC transporter C-terminal domain-containing protein [Christensenellales bacterium]